MPSLASGQGLGPPRHHLRMSECATLGHGRGWVLSKTSRKESTCKPFQPGWRHTCARHGGICGLRWTAQDRQKSKRVTSCNALWSRVGSAPLSSPLFSAALPSCLVLALCSCDRLLCVHGVCGVRSLVAGGPRAPTKAVVWPTSAAPKPQERGTWGSWPRSHRVSPHSVPGSSRTVVGGGRPSDGVASARACCRGAADALLRTPCRRGRRPRSRREALLATRARLVTASRPPLLLGFERIVARRAHCGGGSVVAEVRGRGVGAEAGLPR